ncbi:TadE/TadG family type IV pilus assembly protein [Desertibacillus haloalkaliphilus]|uniref:TadE/TadG family type IV pilus assembly protein n=1 Tax=Desertibacillus haloalkaliphilus TaxID=1328930 RepID=UPI001C2767DF|nr:pilus assembly protein TadG-related protein [Desertibacillus haloalkaliphilus]MBU8908040.1 hypothetical protein [Desertibacillus haloalkaliphilus]
MKKQLQNDQGVVIVIVALMMTGVIGFLALIIDGGMMYLEKSRLQKAVDHAVLAGMQNLPLREDRALAAANEIAYGNGVLPSELTISLSDDHTVLRAEARRAVPLFFAGALGFSDPTVSASATAQVGSLSSVRGAIPLGAYAARPLTFGDEVQLKVGSAGTDTSFFGALQLSGSGSSNFENDLTRGYQGTLSVGDILMTESGNMARPTERAIQERFRGCPYHKTPTYLDHPDDCARVVVIPIYKEVTPGDFSRVRIEGFGSFFINHVGRVNEGAPITGVFLEYSYSGEFSTEITNYGSYAYKLVE